MASQGPGIKQVPVSDTRRVENPGIKMPLYLRCTRFEDAGDFSCSKLCGSYGVGRDVIAKAVAQCSYLDLIARSEWKRR